MSEDFHLIDLVSQAGAVRKILAGKSDAEKLAWLTSRGKLEVMPQEFPNAKQTYIFESVVKREAAFFFHEGDLVFVGDHTIFRAGDE